MYWCQLFVTSFITSLFFLNPTFFPSPWRLPAATAAVVCYLSTMSNTPVNTKFTSTIPYLTHWAVRFFVGHSFVWYGDWAIGAANIADVFLPNIPALFVLVLCLQRTPFSASLLLSSFAYVLIIRNIFLVPFSRLSVTYLLRMSELPHIPDTFYPAFRICH